MEKDTLFTTPFSVKAISSPIGDYSEEHFLGYEWKGEVQIMRVERSEGLAYKVYKRGGQWFFRHGNGEGDIPIDTLKSIRPECPK